MPFCSSDDACCVLNDLVVLKHTDVDTTSGSGSGIGILNQSYKTNKSNNSSSGSSTGIRRGVDENRNRKPSFSSYEEHDDASLRRRLCNRSLSQRSHTIHWAGGTGTWTPGTMLGDYADRSPGVSRKLMQSLTNSQSPFSPSSNGSHSHHHLGGSLKAIPAFIPKTPRPSKARAAFEALVEGLKGCIQVAEEEISTLKEGVREMSLSDGQLQGRIYEFEKTAKTTERTLKKLEYQLSRVEELSEQYSLQQRLREGVRAMAYAFSISQGRERDSALAKVKLGFKECTEVLCSLEGQLETMLGTFKMTMKGIQGFARLCPGDVFEITIKHGIQKWKTRGKIGKDGSQAWDLPRAQFRACLGEVMYIKAAEVKTLGKQILLGNKFCEATELFSNSSQLMTVNLNPSGSLKLNIVVTWAPLSDVLSTDLDYIGYSTSTASPSRKRRLSPTASDFNNSSPGNSSHSHTLPLHNLSSMMGSVSSRNSTPLWERSLGSIDDNLTTVESNSFRFSSLTGSKSARLNVKNAIKQEEQPCSLQEQQTSHSSTQSQNQQPALPRGSLSSCSDPTGNFSLKKRDSDLTTTTTSHPNTTSGVVKEAIILEEESNNIDHSLTHSKNGVMLIMEEDDEHLGGLKSLKDSILKLISFLEDIKGQWPELENLEVQLSHLEKMINDGPGVSGIIHSSSTSSLNIETALECFDFLDSVVVDEDNFVMSSATLPHVESPTPVMSNRIFNVSERYARPRPSTEIFDPKSTARTTDSGISCDFSHSRSPSPSPTRSTTESPAVPLVTGNTDLDVALEVHVNLCLGLIQNLGGYGPLKVREEQSVSKLIQQSEVLEKIISLAKNPSPNSLGRVIDLISFPTLQLLWERITDDSRCPIVTTADMLFNGLELEVRPVVSYKYPKEFQLSSRVAKILTQAMLGNEDAPFNPSTVLTVFQFQTFLLPHHSSFYKLVETVADEELLQNKLHGEGSNEFQIHSLLKSFGERLPSKSLTKKVLRYLISQDKEISLAVREYLQDLICLHSNRNELMNIGLEMLESEFEIDRETGCVLLAEVIESTSAIEQLAFLAQSDQSSLVRKRAKQCLLSLGEEQVLQQCLRANLASRHGFQGGLPRDW